MNLGDDPEITLDEANEAAQSGDMVHPSEIMEMFPDLQGNQILEKLDEIHEEEQPEAPKYEKPRAAARQGRKTYNTGPKGVLTDFEEAKLKMRARRLQEAETRKNKVYMNYDTSQDVTPFQLVDASTQAKKPKKTFREKFFDDKKDDGSNEFDEEIEADDEVMLRWKMQRMKMLDKFKARYGTMMDVNAWTFQEEVYDAPKDTTVVVNVFQDYLERCAKMNFALAKIAIAHPHIKFVRARSDHIGLDDYPEVGLPTLIVFKDGQQLHNFIAVHESIGNPFTVKDVEQFLINQKVIARTAVLPEDPRSKTDDEEIDVNKGKNTTTRIDKRGAVTVSHNVGKKRKAVQQEDSDSELDID